MMTELIEKNIRLQSPSRIEELIKIFVHATKVRRPNVVSKTCKTPLLTKMDVIDGGWVLGDVSVQIGDRKKNVGFLFV